MAEVPITIKLDSEKLAAVKGTVITLALGLEALSWLHKHADLATSEGPQRCQRCCTFAVALLSGRTPQEAEYLRCADAQRRLDLLRLAYEQLPVVLGRNTKAALPVSVPGIRR